MAVNGSLGLALHNVQSGLKANQVALNTTANNVSNVHTEGYSRKTVAFEQRILDGVGAGVQISRLTRSVDENLLRSLRLELSRLSSVDVQGSYYARTQDLFGAPADDASLSHTIGRFAAALESLAVQPQNSLEQREVVRWANESALQLQHSSNTLQDLRLQADGEIAQVVDRINGLLSDIAEINDQVVRAMATGRDATELMDQRDLALDHLAELIDMRVFQRGDGDVVVYTPGGRILVDNVPATLTHSAAAAVGATTTHAEGDLAGIYLGAEIPANDITSELRGGELFGLVELRDRVLPRMQSALDELGAEIRDVVNQVHNRGLAFPGLQQMTGSRLFVDPGVQTITFSGSQDTALVLVDAAGNEVRSTTMRTLLGGASASVSQVATAIDGFLAADGSAAISGDRLTIDLGGSGLYLAFRDQAASAPGSAGADVTLSYDANGDGNADEVATGFSSFFGLNDLFVDGLTDNTFESNVLAANFRATGTTLGFANAGGLLGNVAIAAGTDLAGIVSAVNSAGIGITASLVPDGSGQRLRFAAADGAGIVVTDAAGNTLLDDIGIHPADAGVAATLTVRQDILANPALVSRGAVQWSANLGPAGEYFVSLADDAVARDLAATVSAGNTFDAAGNIAASTLTFDQYAAAILADNATLAAVNDDDVRYREALVQSLETKVNSERSVNLDEEMSNLIVFEQAYSAAARVFATIKDMFDALDRVLG
jgi:flagellar hook-associated protein 1 FlgK